MADERPRAETLSSTGPSPGSPSELPVVAPECYELGPEIARGGLGRLLRARDVRLDRVVALKLLRLRSAHLEARFRREARITARLQHPGIVPIHEAGVWPDGEPFYAMKLVVGESLKEVVAARETLDERLALVPSVLAVAEAMAYAHSEGVIHRDLKPSNVMLGAFGETVVIDWGLAKELGEPDDEHEDEHEHEHGHEAGLTVVGHVLGTAEYLPPEQARGEVVGTGADVYALGAMLYFVLAGRPPYDSADAAAVIEAVRAGPPLGLHEREPGVPPELLAIVAKSMAREVGQRYPHAGAMAADLRLFLTGKLVGAHRYSRRVLLWRWMRRHRAPLQVGLAALVALTLLLVFSVRRIVRARDAARTSESVAVAATQSAESRLGALLLAQAEAALPRDPTAAIGWLKSHARGRSPDPEAITRIAREATARGVAHHVLTGLSLPTVSPDGRLMAAISDQHLVLIELDSLVRRDLGPVDGALGLSFSGDGATLALSAAAGITLWPSAGGAPRPLPDTRGAWATTLDHEGRTVACYRNGRLVVLGLDDQRRIELDSQVMSILALSPDGRTLLGRSYQGDSWLWELEARVSTTLLGTGIVAVLSPAGDRVAWASADGTLTLHEVATGKQRSLGHTSTKVNAVAFSPDGTTIASAGGDGMLTEWSLAGAIVSRRYATTDLGMLSYSPDGARLVALGGDRVVRVWQRGTSFVTSLPAAQARQHVPAWGAGGATLVMTGSDGEVRIFRMPTTLGLGTFALAPPLLQVGLIAGGDVAIAAGDGRVLLMDPSTGKTRVAGKPGQQEQRIAASPASSVVLSSGQDGIVTRYDLATRTDSTMVLDRGQVDSLWYAPDGRSFAVVLADHNIVVVAQGGEAHLLLNRTALASLRFSPDSKQLALSLMASSVRLYDTVKQSSWLLHTSDDEGEADSGALAFSPDGAILAGGGSDGVLRLWSTSQDSTRQLRELRGHKGHINDLAFSPDGASLVTASSDYSARIWDVAAGTARALRHPTVVQCLALSPDGKWLATGDTDGGLRLWQVSSGRLEAVWRQHEGSIERVLFTPDAGHVVSSGVDGNVRSVAVPPPPSPISAADLAELTTAELDRDGQPVSAP